MLGEHSRSEPLFYYVRMDELIPESHLLRLVDKHIDLSFIRNKVKHLYSHTGRPSIDPEVLLWMLLVGYLYGISSERRFCEDVKMHIGCRWFAGLSLEDKIPDHSTFSKNRSQKIPIFFVEFARWIEYSLSPGERRSTSFSIPVLSLIALTAADHYLLFRTSVSDLPA